MGYLYEPKKPRGFFLLLLEGMGFLLPRPPEPPHRTAKCSICGEEIETTKMEGELAHMLCILGMSDFCKAQEERDKQKALIKEALRELEIEKQQAKSPA